jgi:hypothetical protein
MLKKKNNAVADKLYKMNAPEPSTHSFPFVHRTLPAVYAKLVR